MTLYLVQHAKAESKEEGSERPLSEAGWEEIRKIASFAALSGSVRPERIVHSGKLRAAQTAEVLAESLSPTGVVTEEGGLAPGDDVSIWAERLSEAKEDVMLVGHLPHLSRLASQLLCRDESKALIRFRNAGIVALGRDEAGAWSLMWITVPGIVPG